MYETPIPEKYCPTSLLEQCGHRIKEQVKDSENFRKQYLAALSNGSLSEAVSPPIELIPLSDEYMEYTLSGPLQKASSEEKSEEELPVQVNV